MLDALYGDRTREQYLGPTALMQSWMETNNWTNGVHFLAEAKLDDPKKISRHKRIANLIASKDGLELMQWIPTGHGDRCQFSSGACNVVVIDELDETLYFYSRVMGTTWCGKRLHEHGECTSESVALLERLGTASDVHWDFFCASTMDDMKAACSTGSGKRCTQASARQDCPIDQGCMQIQCKALGG
ncbi:hypothetical protein ACHAXR_005140 [Thalassiosira sp. AJA248-18]